MADEQLATTGTGTTATTSAGSTLGKQTGTESALSNYVGPYVTEMLGRGQALGSMDYQGYGGPLTAGGSDLQNQAFSGLAGLTLPTEQMGAFTPTSFTQEGTAQQFMNPYLQGALNPQIDAARRQAEIQRVADAGRLTRAGAFGGSRQGVMEAEGNRGLLDRIAGITGTGYANAYDKAMQQFNTEQNMGMKAQDMTNQYGLGTILKQADLGAAQRGIEGEGIAADRAQFEEERDFPYKQVQYMQSLLQGLPLAAQSYTYQQPTGLDELRQTAGGIQKLYDQLFGSSTPAVNNTFTDIEGDIAGNTE
ncbi:hypothetical protein N9869_00940 [Algibacter sp.]|nr:hypothetical protein [Algibacter sp.]MDB4273866.1 hypothetical protein [Algibacter sp.]